MHEPRNTMNVPYPKQIQLERQKRGGAVQTPPRLWKVLVPITKLRTWLGSPKYLQQYEKPAVSAGSSYRCVHSAHQTFCRVCESSDCVVSNPLLLQESPGTELFGYSPLGYRRMLCTSCNAR